MSVLVDFRTMLMDIFIMVMITFAIETGLSLFACEYTQESCNGLTGRSLKIFKSEYRLCVFLVSTSAMLWLTSFFKVHLVAIGEAHKMVRANCNEPKGVDSCGQSGTVVLFQSCVQNTIKSQTHTKECLYNFKNKTLK